tara:strand:- start:2182 stop:3072 length:891 start_codon:yes stop_codon:yes gene_type:complete
MEIKTDIVYLPTEDKTRVLLNTYIDPLKHKTHPIVKSGESLDELLTYTLPQIKQRGYQPQHLYATVSQEVEPIKEGDWVIYDESLNPHNEYEDKYVIKITKFSGIFEEPSGDFKGARFTHNYSSFHTIIAYLEHCRVIIATTDTKLSTLKGDGTNVTKDGRNQIYTVELIPQLQQSFLKEFTTNPDGEYELEYELMYIDRTGRIFPIDSKEPIFDNRIRWAKLKLNQTNEVNITSVENERGITITTVEEKMYSRDEYEGIIKSITSKEIRDAKAIQHTFRDRSFGEALLYVLDRLD